MNEDTTKHLKNFLTICTTVKLGGHTEERKILRQCTFKLAKDYEEWFNQLPTRSTTTWATMEKYFLNEYFYA